MALRKRKTYILGVAIVFALLITFIIFVFDFIENKNDINWIKDLSYDENQIYDITFGFFNPCPVIPIKIGNKNVALEFDTGNGMGIFITTALKDMIDYEIVGTTTELNADGTYRGEGTSISLKTIKVFGDEFQNVMSSLNDWRMYGFFKINGTIGLKYFDNKVVTLDYDNKKIAVSNKTLDYSKLQNETYTVLPLIRSNLNNEEDLLFVEGEVNGEKCTIYYDTGSSRSFYSLEDVEDEIVVKLGEKSYTFKRNQLRHDEIGFQDDFKYPLKLAINSDLLKANHFVIIIDKIQNNLILCKN